MPEGSGSELTTRKTPSQARSRERVELILDTTRMLLRERGFGQITTTGIAESAGIPVSSVYQYFPNKKAIFVALYEDYLADIRVIYDRFDQPEYLALDWRVFFRRLFREALVLEKRDQIEDELNRAFALYPDLREVDRRHGEETAERLAQMMRKLGSRWQTRRLKRLARFIYALHNGIWAYRSEMQPPARELFEWEFKAAEAVMAECFGED